jgi:hypothetical protein
VRVTEENKEWPALDIRFGNLCTVLVDQKDPPIAEALWPPLKFPVA